MNNNNKVLSIDIGVRNLAFCIMSADDKNNFSTYKIHLWDVYDTLEDDNHLCQGIQKSGKICNKKCGFMYKGNDKTSYCCKTHLPNEIKKSKVIPKENIYKKKLIKSYKLQDIAKIVLEKINIIFKNNEELFKQLKEINIELQPTLNPSAKFISHIIYGKFVELLPSTIIKFVRASTKLRAYTGPSIECKLKGAYAQRKWLSIQYTKYFLENKFSKEQKEKWLPIFIAHKKADDAGDVLHYCINAIHGIPKKQKMNFKNKNL